MPRTAQGSERGLPPAQSFRGGGREERAVRRATTAGRGTQSPSGLEVECIEPVQAGGMQAEPLHLRANQRPL
jgi:hypothetical protein